MNVVREAIANFCYLIVQNIVIAKGNILRAATGKAINTPKLSQNGT
ncbi:MAG: hypothetical protein MGU50_06875 [Trichodesmium sp. MAG_R02]|nr:hypothetical protein [Trichodesmium sp. MAG_R02]